MQLTIGPDYPGTEAMIGELVERGAQVVATDDILAAEPPSTASRIAPSPDVDVVQVCTFPDVVDFERISARGWGYPEPTTEQHEDAYARLTPGWFLARCDEQRAGTAGFALVGEVARLWGAAVVPALRGRGVYRTLVRHRLVAAHTQGATLALVHAAPTSSPILQRLGFAKFGERHTFRVTL
ncbi:GNAT family N-acetyltransferase [Mycolicibacterium mageritense]|uniref:GNAT family N-acetyltransferase n=1 Tax=Mycolicibacterium mageritense TaxID=53462 RepID=UPI001E58C2E4|nr:GNAT family N-acetyltransferase [Mycolicibacterium mageritense]